MITIKTPQEIAIMAEGGKILAKIMKELEKKVKPGITTTELDKVAQDLVLRWGAEPAFKGYEGFPAVLCTCINEEIVHCPPSHRQLKEGDIISLDLGIKYPTLKQNHGLVHSSKIRHFPMDSSLTLKNGNCFYLDMAVTLAVGEVSPEVQRLIRVTKKALKRGIKKLRPGNTVGDISNTIQRYVESQGFNVVRELCGHGIGRKLHEEPEILNYGKRHKGEKLKEGMTLCLEPMVAMGKGEIEKLKDGLGFKTRDNSLSAHFEHTIAVTRNGCEVLTGLER